MAFSLLTPGTQRAHATFIRRILAHFMAGYLQY